MSELRANTISNAAGTGPATLTKQHAAKARITFNGTGTVAINESDNVSSLTDNSTGNYTVNLTSSMATANHTPETSTNASGGGGVPSAGPTGKAVGSITFQSTNGSSVVDNSANHCTTYGALA